jgi:hypothetical protein
MIPIFLPRGSTGMAAGGDPLAVCASSVIYPVFALRSTAALPSIFGFLPQMSKPADLKKGPSPQVFEFKVFENRRAEVQSPYGLDPLQFCMPLQNHCRHPDFCRYDC